MFVIERIAHFSRNLNQYTGTIIMIMQYYSKFKLKVLTSLAQGNVVLSETVGVVRLIVYFLCQECQNSCFGLISRFV